MDRPQPRLGADIDAGERVNGGLFAPLGRERPRLQREVGHSVGVAVAHLELVLSMSRISPCFSSPLVFTIFSSSASDLPERFSMFAS